MEYIDIYQPDINDTAVQVLPTRVRQRAVDAQQYMNALLYESQTHYLQKIIPAIDSVRLVGQPHTLISIYMRYKYESKILLQVLGKYNREQRRLHAEHNTNYSLGRTKQLASSQANENPSIQYHIDLENSLITWNEIILSFDVDFNTLTEDERLLQINTLREFKEQLLSKICLSLLNDVGGEHIVEDRDVTIDNLAGNGVTCLLSIFKTFDSINTRLKGLELTKAENDFALTLATKQLFINELEKENKSLQDSLQELRKRYFNITLEAGRQQIITKQQISIDTLTNAVSQLEKKIESLENVNLQYSNEQRRLQDSIQLLVSQLQEAQRAYEKDISSIQPVIEEHILQTRNGSKEVDALRYELGLRYGRLLVTEMKVKSALDEVNRLRSVNADLTDERDKALERGRCLDRELEHRHKMYRELEEEYGRLLKQYNTLVKEHGELHQSYDQNNGLLEQQAKEFQEVEEYITQLQRIIAEGQEKLKASDKRYTILKAEYKAQEILIEQLKCDVTLLKQRGITTERQREFDEKNKTISNMQMEQSKIERQLKVALNRIQELQDDIQLYKAGLK